MVTVVEDEKTSYTDAVLGALSTGAEAIVPALWVYGIVNVLAATQRTGRMTQAQAIAFLRVSDVLPIAIGLNEAGRRFEILALAAQYQSSIFGAAYRDLALRESMPSATLDRRLAAAANAAGVSFWA